MLARIKKKGKNAQCRWSPGVRHVDRLIGRKGGKREKKKGGRKGGVFLKPKNKKKPNRDQALPAFRLDKRMKKKKG